MDTSKLMLEQMVSDIKYAGPDKIYHRVEMFKVWSLRAYYRHHFFEALKKLGITWYKD